MPFAALHLIGEDGRVTFAGSCGSDETHPDHWRGAAETAVAGERVLEDGHAVLLPVARPGSAVPAAALILGTSPTQRLDDGYRDFFRMVARQLSGALSSAVGLAAAQTRAEELAELDRAKTEFFSNVSHEFRTPLTLMLGPLGDALADPDPDPAVQRERIEVAHRGALRLLRLVNALLDLSRFESGRVTAALRAGRPRPARARDRRGVPLGGRPLRARARDRRSRGGRDDRRRCGHGREDPPQPALQRLQVHARGPDRAAACGSASGR